MSKAQKKQAGGLAKEGRFGDTMLVHMNPAEFEEMQKMFPGGFTINPETGQPEMFWPALIAMAGAGAAAVGGAAKAVGGAVKGAAMKAGGAVKAGVQDAVGGVKAGVQDVANAKGLDKVGAAQKQLGKVSPGSIQNKLLGYAGDKLGVSESNMASVQDIIGKPGGSPSQAPDESRPQQMLRQAQAVAAAPSGAAKQIGRGNLVQSLVAQRFGPGSAQTGYIGVGDPYLGSYADGTKEDIVVPDTGRGPGDQPFTIGLEAGETVSVEPASNEFLSKHLSGRRREAAKAGQYVGDIWNPAHDQAPSGLEKLLHGMAAVQSKDFNYSGRVNAHGDANRQRSASRSLRNFDSVLANREEGMSPAEERVYTRLSLMAGHGDPGIMGAPQSKTVQRAMEGGQIVSENHEWNRHTQAFENTGAASVSQQIAQSPRQEIHGRLTPGGNQGSATAILQPDGTYAYRDANGEWTKDINEANVKPKSLGFTESSRSSKKAGNDALMRSARELLELAGDGTSQDLIDLWSSSGQLDDTTGGYVAKLLAALTDPRNSLMSFSGKGAPTAEDEALYEQARALAEEMKRKSVRGALDY